MLKHFPLIWIFIMYSSSCWMSGLRISFGRRDVHSIIQFIPPLDVVQTQCKMTKLCPVQTHLTPKWIQVLSAKHLLTFWPTVKNCDNWVCKDCEASSPIHVVKMCFVKVISIHKGEQQEQGKNGKRSRTKGVLEQIRLDKDKASRWAEKEFLGNEAMRKTGRT